MSTDGKDAAFGKPLDERCGSCGSGLAAARRYCLECGARRGPLPAVVADRVNALKERGRREGEGADASPAEPAVGTTDAQSTIRGRWDWMPSPQVAAVAVMALLAAGVVLGSVTSPLARSAGGASIVLEELGGSEPEVEEEAETATTEASAAPATASYAPATEAPLAAPLEAPAAEPEARPPPKLPPELPEEELLPEIKHVFLIVLDGHGFEEAFGVESSAPYLSKTLAGEGKLLANYYAVAQGALANQVALLSGQGPTSQMVAGCPEYKPIAPGTLSPEGQVEGDGCVYPAETETLPTQLTKAKLSWKAYVEAAGGDEASTPQGSCYLTLRNPFAYFASVADSAECAENDVSLDQLAPDLKEAQTTPTLSYILPNSCHDGSDTPCAAEQPAGLAPADAFLETVVPQIVASPAYELEGGLIAITFDQAPQEGEAADSGSCCATPEYPNLPPPPESAEPATPGPVKPNGGGGRVGMLLISPYVAPGTVEETAYYNHFSFLRSIEELLGLEPLGYAAEPALTGFDSSVFDASPEESTAPPGEKPAP
ncbi:MAG TPA: alkaline phosphatase family protein [Solirubrobacterales bacterium]|nr:alkaline phosphatase family protein [Solirubrobacterales bacterium]